jgi:hypothetical protein
VRKAEPAGTKVRIAAARKTRVPSRARVRGCDWLRGLEKSPRREAKRTAVRPRMRRMEICMPAVGLDSVGR